MLETLDKIYITKSTAMQLLCRGSIEELKLIDYDSVDEFFCAFEQACNKFKEAGGKMPADEKVRYMLKALPKSYDVIVDYYDRVDGAKANIEFIKSKIRRDIFRRETKKEKNVSTFHTQSKGCYECGSKSNFIRDCPKAAQSSSSSGRGASRGCGRGGKQQQ